LIWGGSAAAAAVAAVPQIIIFYGWDEIIVLFNTLHTFIPFTEHAANKRVVWMGTSTPWLVYREMDCLVNPRLELIEVEKSGIRRELLKTADSVGITQRFLSSVAFF